MTVRLPFLALLAVVASVGCKADDSGDKQPPAVVNVQTIVVTPQPFTETLAAMGTVVTRAGHVATLSAPAAGRVSTISVTTGQTVQQGQTLVELDQAPFESALRAAQAAAAAAEQANERAQRLATEGIVPRKDAETAAADVARARADVATAQRMSQLSILKAPISGVITRMTASLGAAVDVSQPLVEISDLSAVDILLNATPTDAARVRPGAKVALTAGSTSSGEPLGVGTVMDVAGTVDSTSRGVSIRVQAPTTRRSLMIGETVSGAVSVGTQPNAIVIPNEALVPEGDAFKVFVVDATGMAHDRDVKVGGRSDKGVQITEGLAAGERIVTYGAYGVSDSAKVAPLTRAGAAKAVVDSAKPEKP